MLYFEVYEHRLSGNIEETGVASDGSWCASTEKLEDEASVVLGYRVWEYYENGTTKDIVYYPVCDNGEHSNSDEVLEQIKEDHPAGEWQNNDW